MKIESDRIFLREFVMEDAPELFSLNSNPFVMKYIGRPPDATIDESIALIEKQIIYYQENKGLGAWPVFLKDTLKFMGIFLLKYLDHTNFIEIGYRLKPEYWGKGFATEMGKELINYGFHTLNLEKIVGITHPENLPSQNVLKKLGLNYIKDSFYYDMNVKFFEISKPL